MVFNVLTWFSGVVGGSGDAGMCPTGKPVGWRAGGQSGAKVYSLPSLLALYAL